MNSCVAVTWRNLELDVTEMNDVSAKRFSADPGITTAQPTERR